MSEVFDPEKVERLTIPKMPPIEFIRASDFDKLLALYREALQDLGRLSPISLDIPRQ